LIRVRTTVAALLFFLLGVGLIGHLTRDIHLFLAWGFMLPLLPIALAALLFDLLMLGRAFPRGRLLLGLMATFVGLWDASHLWNFHSSPPPERERPEICVVQWNVRWGGKPWGRENWNTMKTQIVDSKPDIVILSEAPFEGTQLLEEMCKEQSWSIVRRGSEPEQPYVYQLAVCSRWPMVVEDDRDVANGHVMTVRVERSGQPLRVMVVDVESNPFSVPRRACFDEVYPLMEHYAAQGTPIDIVAGDFNTPGRSVALDRFPTLGYVSASRWVSGWRGTWPSECPLVDIDHVWIYRSWRVQRCDMLDNPYTDHRGHHVRMQP